MGMMQKDSIMKSSKLSIALVIAGLCSSVFAQDRIDLQSDTTVLEILQGTTGQIVELYLDSGDKVGGKVEQLSENLIHLSHLTGAESLDAFVDVESVSAVIVRGK
jgi:hypothetical protein